MLNKRIAAASALVLLLAAQGFGAGIENFLARMLTGGGPNQEPVQSVRIEIDAYSTEEEIAQMADVFNSQGWEPFISVFRATKKGVIRFMGTRGYNVTIHAAHSFPTDKGRKVMLFTEMEVWDSQTRRIQAARESMFMVVELDLDAKGKGEGNIYHQASIRFNPDRTLKLENFTAAPKVLVNVKTTK